MVAYNFQKKFVSPIVNGKKPHTIRGCRKRATVPGDALQFYIGLRTKKAFMFARSVCTKVEPVIIYPFIGHIRKNGELMEENAIEELAKADGFENPHEFFGFFRDVYGLSELDNFEIIHWDVDALEAWLPPNEDMLKAVHDGKN